MARTGNTCLSWLWIQWALSEWAGTEGTLCSLQPTLAYAARVQPVPASVSLCTLFARWVNDFEKAHPGVPNMGSVIALGSLYLGWENTRQALFFMHF